MSGPITETASWTHEYEVTFAQSGLDSSASGSEVVNVNAVAVPYDQLPYSLWVDSGGQVNYAYESIVSSSNPGEQFGLDTVNGPSSPISVTGPVTLTGYYVTQYYLTVQTSPPSVDSPSGQGWYNASTYASVSTSQYVDIVSGSSRYNFTGWTTGDMTEITSSTSPLTTVLMDEAKTVTANYMTQYSITFDQSGVGSDFTGTVVTVDGTGYGVSGGLPAVFWWDANSVHSFAYESPLVVDPSAEQYVWVNTTGLSTVQGDSITVTAPGTITGNYKTQYYLTLATDPSGVNSPSGAGWYDVGTNATISTNAFVDIVSGSSRYRFNGWTTGNMVEIADATRSPTSVLMNEAKTVTADYIVQYNVTFSQSGVGSDFTGPIFVVDGINYYYGSSPSFWWDSGSPHTFAYQSPLVVTAYSEQYNWTSTTGLSTSQTGSIIVSNSGSVTGNYETQYYLTVNSLYDSPNPLSQWFDNGTSITANVSPTATGAPGVRQACTGWIGTGSAPASGSGTSFSFIISQPSSITWNWQVQYYLTVETDPLGITTIPGEGWYASMASVTLTAPTVPSYNFTYWDVDGPSQGSGVNPITVTMDAPHNATAHYSTLAAPLTVSISPTMTTITLGGSVTFTSTVSGGTAPYSYQWYLDDPPVAGANSSTWTFTPTASGIYYIYLVVNDSSGNTASSTLARILVVTTAIGGYAVSFTEPEPAGSVGAYFGLVALFGIALIIVKRKRK
jgi:hypothetical protein